MSKKREIVSLNPELYEDLSIAELEERLEMGCYIDLCGVDEVCGVDGQSCVGNVTCTCAGDISTCGVLICFDAG